MPRRKGRSTGNGKEKIMGEVVIALNGDSETRWYGLGATGVGHLVMTGTGMHTDPLTFAASLYKPCGGKELETARLSERFNGDKRCTRCVAWLASATGVSELEAARADKWAAEHGKEAAAEFAAALFEVELGTDGKPWTPGDNPARRVSAWNTPAPDSTPLPIPRIVPAPAVDAADAAGNHAATVADERERRTARATTKNKRAAKGGNTLAPVRTRDDVRSAVETARATSRTTVPDAREESAPAVTVVNPVTDIVASTGKPLADMIAETKSYYANGGAVPGEIVQLANRGTGGPVDLSVLVCEFKGAVSMINMERTHGKCPGCTTYIPLLPEAVSKGDAKPKVSKDRCPGTGEAPVPGSRVERDDHTVSLPDDVDRKHSGRCPACPRIIAVSREGGMRKHNGVIAPVESDGESVDRIGTHNVGGVATPATKGRLKDKSVDVVEHGSTPGDPSDANARRAAETRCPRSNKVLAGRETPGKVECPNEECGRTVELKAKPKKDGTSYAIPTHTLRGRVTVGDDETIDPASLIFRNDGRNVTPFGTGADAGKGQRDHGSVDGSAIVSAVNMAPIQPGGWLGTAGTGQLPAGLQSGIDPIVSGEWCPICKDLKEIAHRGRSRGWRRTHSKIVGAVLRDREEKREVAKVAEIKRGEAIPTRVRKALRKAAAVGSFAEGVNAHTGVVTHVERPVGRAGTGAYSPVK